MDTTTTMPSALPPYRTSSPKQHLPTRLPFPPLTKSHILHCCYHHWYPKYRHLTPPSILIPLPQAFLTYLRADGIILPPTTPSNPSHPDPLTPPDSDADSDTWSSNSSSSDSDPSLLWPDVHLAVQRGIRVLGGKALPKLNWSAPKDATWMVAGNSMECSNTDDVYLLLKSSDFVSHDLEQWGDGCVDDSPNRKFGDDGQLREEDQEVLYHLILRKPLPNFSPASEFRCFVRSHHLIAISQRDLNYYAFLTPLRSRIIALIESFFEKELKDTFDGGQDFVFDVYLPLPRSERVWLIDVNPWAPRTDPILFSWMEVLGMRAPGEEEEEQQQQQQQGSEDSESEEEVDDLPELRLVGRDDPEAYAFNTPQYSAHKLPKDVVDAGNEGEAGLREFLGTWREIERRQEREDADGGGE